MFSNKDLRKLLIPLLIEQFLCISLGLFDTVMVSSVGEAAVSGVSIVDMINVLIIDLFGGIATGGAVIVSQYLGALDKKKASKSGSQLLVLCGVLGLFFYILVLLLNKEIMYLLFGTIEQDVMESALTYFKITAISFPFISIYNGAAALFRSMGNSRISMVSSLFINLVNIGGNALLIFVFDMGVAGAAIATTVSRFIAMAYLLIKLFCEKHDLSISILSMKPDFSIMKKIMRIGIPSGFESSMFQLGRVIVVTLISTFGTAQIAANAFANNLDSFGVIPGKALQLAAITIVGQCVGAGREDEAIRYTKKIVKWSYITMAIFNIVIEATLPLTIQLYNISDEAKHLGIILVLIHTGFAMLIWTPSFVLQSCLRAGGDVQFPMIVVIGSMWVFRIVFSYIFGKYCGLGAIGVWIAMVMDWIFRMIMFIWRFKSGKWLHESISKRDLAEEANK